MEQTSEKDLIEFILKETPRFDPPDIISPEDNIWGIEKKSADKDALFERDDIHPMVYEFLLLKKYKTEWIFWEPETLWWAITKDFDQVTSKSAQNKIQAIRTIQSIDRYWREIEIFEDVSLALNNIIPDFDKVEFVSPSQMALSVEIADTVDKKDFNDDVGVYVAAMCSESGLVFLSDPLKRFQKYFEKLPNYDVILDLVIRCEKKWSGLNLKDMDNISLADDDPVDIQIAKNIAIKNYLQYKDDQFSTQIKLIGDRNGQRV